MTEEEKLEYRRWKRQYVLPKLNELGDILQDRQAKGLSVADEIGIVTAVIEYADRCKAEIDAAINNPPL